MTSWTEYEMLRLSRSVAIQELLQDLLVYTALAVTPAPDRGNTEILIGSRLLGGPFEPPNMALLCSLY
jgi:hypothetical protein